MTVNAVLCQYHTTDGLHIDMQACGVEEARDPGAIFDVFREAHRALTRLESQCYAEWQARHAEVRRLLHENVTPPE